jgi:hypothetical protein
MIDFIEPLQKLPSRTLSRAHRLHDDLAEIYGAMIMQVKARMDAGEDVPDCLVKTLLLTQEEEKLDWEDLCMLSAVFTLGGVHSVRLFPNPLQSGLIRRMPDLDFQRDSVVPGPHLFISRYPGKGTCRARYGDWPRLLAIGRRRIAPAIYASHHQGSA